MRYDECKAAAKSEGRAIKVPPENPLWLPIGCSQAWGRTFYYSSNEASYEIYDYVDPVCFVDRAVDEASCPLAREELLSKGRDCPEGGSCVNGNKPFKTFADAWKACGIIAECGFIMKHPTRGYYLRRASDPPARDGRDAWPGMEYSCGMSTRSCSVPVEVLPSTGKDCPKVGSSYSCVNDNVPFGTFADAWKACGRIAECGFIMKHPTRGYFLRRASDPPAIADRAAWPGVVYSC